MKMEWIKLFSPVIVYIQTFSTFAELIFIDYSMVNSKIYFLRSEAPNGSNAVHMPSMSMSMR